jgi:DNA modification methylase/ParB-like chromosome segregation protein Spo0J
MSNSSLPPTNIIKINPEYSKLVNPLSDIEYEALKSSISNKGLHLPIIVNQDNVILDGHNRLKICQELGIKPIFEIKEFQDPLQEKEFVIEINLKRRHLNNFQIAELEYKMEEIYKEKAKLRSLSNLKNVKENISTAPNDAIELDKVDEDEETGKVSEIIARKTGLSPRTYERAKKIIEEGSDEAKEKLRSDKTTIFKEYDKIQRDLKRQELLSKLNSIESNDKSDSNQFQNSNYKLIYGDFIEKSQMEIPGSSIDLIFTDPPYGKEYLPLYHELAKLAMRVLKPGGSIVFYVGHIILDQVIRIFHDVSLTNNNLGLKYWWISAVKHSGSHTKIHPRHVFAEWKPLLWYVKGNQINDLAISNTIGDYIESSPPPKIEHEWQQSTVEAQYVIKNLTIENQIVLDPMMGSGTTGIAALNLKRKFIGIEKNQETFEISKVRINKQDLRERIKEER